MERSINNHLQLLRVNPEKEKKRDFPIFSLPKFSIKMIKLRLNKKRGIIILFSILLVVSLGFFVFKAVDIKALDKTIDNMDLAGSWTTSDATNLAKSQETTIKTEGTGSIKVIANSGATDDVYYFLKTKAAGNHTIATRYASIDLEMEVKSGNQTISTDTSWGNATPDTRMLGVRVEGDLTIDAGKTLTATTRKKGMVILVEGDLNLNGTISMTARGANVAGQHVLLLDDGTEYEIPAVGGAGAPQTNSGGNPTGNFDGADGTSGVATGASGGGGAGGACSEYPYGAPKGGAGSDGTSYSGGAGGGAAVAYSTDRIASPGGANGGAGGNANSHGDKASAGGGAGNPGGAGAGSKTGGTGGTGTGGLLVLYVAGTLNFGASGTLEAKGENGGAGQYEHRSAGGGGSGGGHVGYFYQSVSGSPTIDVSGGIGGSYSLGDYCHANGGSGGNGTTRAIQSTFPSALNDTITRDFGAGNEKDLSDVTQIKFDIRSSRTGTYLQFGWGESAYSDNLSNITINSANTWETKTIDISGFSNSQKDAVRYLGFKVTNADSNFTMYIDNIIWANKTTGSSCTEDSDCDSGFCVDGYCCDSACTGTCQRCDATPGTCTTRAADDNTECGTCYKCDGVNINCQAVTADNGKNCNTDCTKCSAGSCDTRAADDNTECSACNRCDGVNTSCQAQTGETGYLCTNDCYDCVTGTCTAMTEDDDGTCNSDCDSCVAGVCTIRAADDNTECPSCYRCNGIDNICHYFCGGPRSTPTPIFFISGCENIPETGGEVKETFKSKNIAKVVFPSNAIEGTVAVGIKPQDKTEVIKSNPLPQNTQIVGDLVADFKAFSAISGTIKELESFKEEISITFSYTDEQLKEANLDEKTLKIYKWDETNNIWDPLETQVDTILNQVTTNTSHFTLFALMGQELTKEEKEEPVEEEKPIEEMTIEELKAKIREILTQITALQAKINQLLGKEIKEIPAGYRFSKYLWYGQKDEEVRYLQIFLKSQGPEIYPEGLVTGYFKSLTEAALKRFQIKYGIVASEEAEGAGFCGPKTRAKINEILGR